MATWSSRGLRGSMLEEEVNMTNERYRDLGLALIQKIPTPIKPIEIDQSTRHITLAYFDQKSTVDYIGTVQGVPICFDAKECKTKTFPLQNVHRHQVEFMRDFEKQGGLAFFLLYYSSLDRYFYQPFNSLFKWWSRMENGGRKSFTFDEMLEDCYEIFPGKNGVLIHYLEGIKEDLTAKFDNQEKR